MGGKKAIIKWAGKKKKKKWGTVVVIDEVATYDKFISEEEAEKRLDEIQKNNSPIRAGVISLVDPIPVDPNIRKPRSKYYYWCPYCGNWRRFRIINSYRRCEFCGVTDSEYYVRQANHLWGK